MTRVMSLLYFDIIEALCIAASFVISNLKGVGSGGVCGPDTISCAFLIKSFGSSNVEQMNVLLPKC